MLRHLCRQAVKSPGGKEVGHALALFEAAGAATSLAVAAEVCMGSEAKAAKRLGRAIAANWEPSLVARMLAAMPMSLLPYHQLLREFTCVAPHQPNMC